MKFIQLALLCYPGQDYPELANSWTFHYQLQAYIQTYSEVALNSPHGQQNSMPVIQQGEWEVL